LKTWNRYCRAGVAVNGAVAAPTTSVAGPVEGFTPPVGDCATGAVTFNVEPSDAVPDAPPVVGVVGARGVLEFEVHARASPSSTVTPVTAIKFRDINGSRNELNKTWGLWRVLYAERSRLKT
jgi:hypothetical protein